MELKRVLVKVANKIGYSKLQPKQEEVILDLVSMSDVFVNLSTRSSKLVCYCLLTAVFDEVCELPACQPPPS